MGIFDVFKKKPEPLAKEFDQAVIIKLRGSGLPEETYDTYDLSTLEDQIMEVIDGTGIGEYDGNEFGPDGATIYLYAPNADQLYERIENTLKAYPLCRDAQVTIRYGKPGAAQRQVAL
jgi:hypothetical protein